MSESVKNTLLFLLVGALIVITGFMQSWSTALLILNMGLVSAIMALGRERDGDGQGHRAQTLPARLRKARRMST